MGRIGINKILPYLGAVIVCCVQNSLNNLNSELSINAVRILQLSGGK